MITQKEVATHYKSLRRAGLDSIDAHNKTLDNLGGRWDGPDNIASVSVRREVSDLLRGNWRHSFDRVMGIKSGKYTEYYVLGLDVYGNAKDGFEINNQWKCGSIRLPEDCNDRDVFRILRDQDFLSDASKGTIRLENNSAPEYIEIVDRKNGRPILDLEMVEV